MGNLKISKAKKNKNSKGTSGIPNWLLSTLVIIVVLAVLATCIGTFVASSGITMKHSTAMSLDDYKVNGNMMKYFYQTTYMNFMNNYQSYLSYLSFNQSLSHKDQPFNPEGSYDSMFLQTAESYETWFDFFAAQTTDSVKSLLIYCKEADKLGVTLDQDEIDISVENLITNIRLSLDSTGSIAISDKTCIETAYGKGVTKADIRKAIEISTLASKTAEHISKTLENAISDDRINKKYDDNKLDYNLVDYFSYSFDVYYSDVISELYGDKKVEDLTADEKNAALALYKEKIANARESANALATKNTLDDFRAWVIDYAAKDLYKSKFDSATTKLTSEQKPAESDLATIKDKTIAAVIKDVTDGKDAATEDVVTTEAEGTKTYTLYDIKVSAEFAEAAKTLKNELFKSVKSAKEDGLMEKANYVKPDKDGKKDDLSEWAFNELRKANDVNSFETGDIPTTTTKEDGTSEVTVEAKTERFTVEVAILTKTVYRDETLSRNFSYMLFTKEENAKKAIEALEVFASNGELTVEKFKEVSNDENNAAAAYQDAEDYIVGKMESDAFDEWLFAAEKVNDFTKTAIKMGEGSFMVAIYTKQGDLPAWKNTVKGTIYDEDYTAYETKMNEDFGSGVVINKNVINKISA